MCFWFLFAIFSHDQLPDNWWQLQNVGTEAVEVQACGFVSFAQQIIFWWVLTIYTWYFMLKSY